MRSKTIALFVLFMVILISTGCTKELTSAEIQSKLIEANSGLNSYSVDMKMDMDMVTELLGEQTNIKSVVTSAGDVDLVNKKMFLKGTVNYDMSGMKMEVDTETYIIDDYMYIKTMNMWMKMKLDEDIWARQDQVKQLIELVQSGTVERLEDEMIDGNSYYVIKLNPALKTVVEITMQQQAQSGLLNNDMDFADMIKSYESTLWVNKKTFIVEKSTADMKMVMTPQNMGIKDAASSNAIDVTASTDVKISDINKEVIVTLPEEAKTAVEMPSEMLAGGSGLDTGMSPVTGQAIGEAFS